MTANASLLRELAFTAFSYRSIDDGSGRQQWKLAPHPSGRGLSIQVRCACGCPRSCPTRQLLGMLSHELQLPYYAAVSPCAVCRPCAQCCHLPLLPHRLAHVLRHLGGAGPYRRDRLEHGMQLQ